MMPFLSPNTCIPLTTGLMSWLLLQTNAEREFWSNSKSRIAAERHEIVSADESSGYGIVGFNVPLDTL